MAQKLKEFVRNSPLNRRRFGGYGVLESEQNDPFQQGISFHAHYVGSLETKSKQDNHEVQQIILDAWKEAQKTRFRKIVITIKSSCLRVKDVRTKIVDNYPIYLVSYCGASLIVEELFFFIHKTKIDKMLRLELFKLSSSSKVNAITLTVAKAFNIAYKAWIADNKLKERKNSKGSDSSLPIHHQMSSGGIKRSHLEKMAPGIASTEGPYTPPAGRKVLPDENTIKKSGSYGDLPGETAAKSPAVTQMRSENEVTGSTHNVFLTDEFSSEFQQISETVPQPDLLPTNIDKQPDKFNWQEVVKYTDSGSVEDLTDIM